MSDDLEGRIEAAAASEVSLAPEQQCRAFRKLSDGNYTRCEGHAGLEVGRGRREEVDSESGDSMLWELKRERRNRETTELRVLLLPVDC